MIKNEAGKDLKCIIAAIDSYREEIALQNNNKFYIEFTFSELYIKYLKSNIETIHSFPGNRDGGGNLYNSSSIYGITVENIFKRDNLMKRFSTKYKGCRFEAFLRYILDENESRFYYEVSTYKRRKLEFLKRPRQAKYKWEREDDFKGLLLARRDGRGCPDCDLRNGKTNRQHVDIAGKY